jgi:hypothetical protein
MIPAPVRTSLTRSFTCSAFEIQPDPAARLFGRHASLHFALHLQFEVALNLAVEFCFSLAATK